MGLEPPRIFGLKSQRTFGLEVGRTHGLEVLENFSVSKFEAGRRYARTLKDLLSRGLKGICSRRTFGPWSQGDVAVRDFDDAREDFEGTGTKGESRSSEDELGSKGETRASKAGPKVKVVTITCLVRK